MKAATMNRQFILRIEQQGRVSYQVVRGHREALELAHAFAVQTPGQRVAVLDATGRIIWQAAVQSAA